MRPVMALLALGCALSSSTAWARPRACIVPELGLPLAGRNAVDCGVAEKGKRWQRARVAKCAREAIARGMPVRFGVGVMGIDAFGCDVAVRDDEGRFYLIRLDWDVAADERPRVYVGRCPEIDPEWKDSAAIDHFGPRDCVSDDAAFTRAEIRLP